MSLSEATRRKRSSTRARALGAHVELVARYHELDIDDDAFIGGADSFANPASSASKASAWGVGVNWYLTQNYKWSLNYDVTSFEGGAADGATGRMKKLCSPALQSAFDSFTRERDSCVVPNCFHCQGD